MLFAFKLIVFQRSMTAKLTFLSGLSSILSRDYEWENFHLDINDYDEDDWDDWIIQQYFEKSAVDNGNLQLAYKLGIEEEEPVLCIYKDHKLLGAYVECDIETIKRLIDYDDKLVAEDLDTYKKLLKLLIIPK